MAPKNAFEGDALVCTLSWVLWFLPVLGSLRGLRGRPRYTVQGQGSVLSSPTRQLGKDGGFTGIVNDFKSRQLQDPSPECQSGLSAGVLSPASEVVLKPGSAVDTCLGQGGILDPSVV